MLWEIDLRKYFTRKTIALALQSLDKPKRKIMDLFYKRRDQHPFPVIGISKIKKIIRNVPVVRRGSRAVPLSGSSLRNDYIEPQGIRVYDFVGGKELNDIKLLVNEGLKTGLQQWVNGKVRDARDVVGLTTEVLCAQSLRGRISYPMQTDDGMDLYEVEFGDPLTFSPEKYWDTNVTTKDEFHKLVVQITSDLRSIEKHIQKNSGGYGSDIRFFIGQKVFEALDYLVQQFQNDTRIQATTERSRIVIKGYVLELLDYTYYDPKTEEFKLLLEENQLMAAAMDAPFTLYYIALDELKAQLQPMPLFIYPIQVDDPSGFKLLEISKPLPIPVPQSICWATVAAP